jgi:hypothetical protein
MLKTGKYDGYLGRNNLFGLREFITQYGIEGLNNPHAHKNTNVQFMSRDDYVIMNKSEYSETVHIDNKHHLYGLRAPVSLLYWSELWGCCLDLHICIHCQIVKPCSFLSAGFGKGGIYHVHR